MTELRTIPRAPARAAERVRKVGPPRNSALALASGAMVIATLAAAASITPSPSAAPTSASTPLVPAAPSARELFFDDFEGGLGAWEVSNPEVMTIIDSGDAEHGHVFRLAPAEAQIASLIRGSEEWPAYRIEGEVLFPTDEHNYLGWIYNYRENERRADLGSLYIKGNGTYIRVNPRRDWNPARMLYEEYFTRLTGDDAIVIGEWQRFAAEVEGRVCHLYVGDMSVPKVTFEYYEGDSGKAGFKPRVVGGPVWIDNIRAEAIDGLSYTGPRRPEGIEYHRDELVTDWRVLGPLTRAYLDLEKLPAPGAVAGTAASRDSGSVVDDGVERRWQPFPADPRGAVVTGRVVEFLGSRSVAYFATTISVPPGEDLEIQFSTLDDLALWRNGIFRGYVNGEIFAWHDFGRNPEHPPSDWMRLEPGVNHVLVRVRGGIYATGGFFARVAPAGSAQAMLSAR